MWRLDYKLAELTLVNVGVLSNSLLDLHECHDASTKLHAILFDELRELIIYSTTNSVQQKEIFSRVTAVMIRMWCT